MRVLIAAGGTGGHIYPGIAIAQQLRKNMVEVFFVGRRKGIEAEIINKYKFLYKGIYSGSFPRKISIAFFNFFFKLIIGFIESVFILKKIKPEVIVGTGGYVSFPVILGGYFLRIPILIHEQNIIPGLSNRVLAKFANKIAISFITSKKYFNQKEILVTGNPIREEILSVDTDSVSESLQLEKNRMTILILGGSSGAHSLNLATINALDFLITIKDKIQIVHLTGAEDYELVDMTYKQKDYLAKAASFIYDIQNAYRSADLVICRAGATTLAEITALGLPCIVIPYPFATDDHQRKNAELIVNQGAGVMILNQELTSNKLATEILNLINDKEKLHLMASNSRKLGKPKAAEKIADLIYSLAKQNNIKPWMNTNAQMLK